ncbi:MAG: Hsp33 family molecular chaperone HslO, partial [Paracoccaceae bacterium]
MTSAAQIAWDDTVLPFQLDRSDIRGRVVRLDAALDTILSQHDYPAPVAKLVAEAALMTALIGQTVKLRWKLSLQARSDGPVRIIATDYFAAERKGEPALIRAYASFDAARLDEIGDDPFTGHGKGVFAILIDQGDGTVPYQGITPLAGGSLAACAATYFAQSEQLPTEFALAAVRAARPGEPEAWRGGGIMIQHMPKSALEATNGATGHDGLMAPADFLFGEAGENWNRVSTLLETVELTELIGPHVSPDELLLRLFHEETPRVFPAQGVRFGCTCGPEKVTQTLSVYSAKDIATMTTPDGKVTADCQFCGAHYELDPGKLG